MADTTVNTYRDTYTDPYASKRKTSNTTTGQNLNMIMGDTEEVSVDDFLNLMVAQIKNQDFLNPMEDIDFVTQLAQFATMTQMQELATYSKSNYVSSLIGRTVTASKFTVSGDTNTQTGMVQKVSLVDDEYTITVNGENYTLSQIMEIKDSDAKSQFDASAQSITSQNVKDTWAEIKWPPASTDESLQGQLLYTVYCSTEKMGDTPEEVMKNGTACGGANLYSESGRIIDGLRPGTTYFLNVVVEDGQGNKSLYKPLAIRTEGTAAG